MVRYKRNLATKIVELLKIFPAVVVLGARQVGKTTLCRQLYPDWKYFDLQNPQHKELITNDLLGTFERYPQNLIIDEAQEISELFAVLRGIIDQNRSLKGRFLITGSSSPELLHKSAETLAGRVAIVHLSTLKANEQLRQPLSKFYEIFYDPKHASEILHSITPNITKPQFINHWLTGGYPEPTTNYSLNSYKQWMDNYFATYINTDIVRLFPGLKKHILQRFLKMICHLNGTIVNKRDLARNLEISEKTVAEYINIANGTFLWRELLSYHVNTKKTLIKMPKGYMRDSGLLHYLLHIYTIDDLYNHPISGRSFEAFIIEEILNGLNATMLTNWQGYHYRTKHGAEIDLILEGDFGIIPIEIKQSTTITPKQLLSLTQFIDDHKLSLGLVINQSNELLWLNKNILQVPFTYL